jgi:hypothetical protein
MGIIAGLPSSGGFERGAKVEKDTAGTAGNKNNIPVPWDTEQYDNNGHWAVSPNPERLTVGSGFQAVMLGASIWNDQLASTRLRSAITINGSITDDSAVHNDEPIGLGDDPAHNLFTGPIDVGASTDYYTVVQNTADTFFNYSPWGNFWIMVLPS